VFLSRHGGISFKDSAEMSLKERVIAAGVISDELKQRQQQTDHSMGQLPQGVLGSARML
jgi:hypothetical protein